GTSPSRSSRRRSRAYVAITSPSRSTRRVISLGLKRATSATFGTRIAAATPTPAIAPAPAATTSGSNQRRIRPEPDGGRLDAPDEGTARTTALGTRRL